MATNNTTTGSGPQPDPSGLASQLKEAFAEADSVVAERIQNLQWMRQARGAQLARAAADLKAELGANDVVVRRAEEAAAAARAAGARLSSLHRQMTTEDPQVAPDGWAVHGYVSTADGKPVSRFTVFLVDAANAYQELYGFANTDDAGRFVLVWKPVGTESGQKSKAHDAPQGPELFVKVTDLRSRPVYLDTTPLPLGPGSVTYKDIELAEGAPPMGQPPGDASRAVPKSRPRKK
jgi:hypothetical protein